jgi:hypothetical protein
LFLLGGGAAQAQPVKLTLSPIPAVAGEPITATFEGITIGCSSVGTLKNGGFFRENEIHLVATPPGCNILPPFVYSGYTATTTLGPLAAGVYTVLVLADNEPGTVLAWQYLEVKAPPACRGTETSLCLGDGRFEVTGEWTDFQGHHGAAHAVPNDLQSFVDYGVFWFFNFGNAEMVVKVLDACSYNGHYWVFLSPASTVKYDIKVRDVRTGQQKTYSNPLGKVPSLIADTTAFPCS